MDTPDLLRLEALRQRNKSNPSWVNGDLYRMLFKRDYYIVAYERLKSNPGNMTPGPDGTTLDGFSTLEIEKIIAAMRDESFRFSPSRQQEIPKKSGGKRRLSIAPPKDKVVQEVIRMILEAIYDPPGGNSFSEHSHGFRETRSCHTALKEIHYQWSGVSWIIEGDIKAAFDSVDHGILISILRERIRDERFLNLVRKALTAGYYEFVNHVVSVVGTPQGSIISPILSNIYLDKLDKFVEGLVRKYERGKERGVTPEYRRLQRDVQFHRRKVGEAPNAERREHHLRELKRAEKALMETPAAICDGEYIRVKYVRYADDWCIGVNGPKELAEKIREEVATFLAETLKLTLSLEKTHIRHAKTEEAFFLGVRVKIGSDSPRRRTVKRNSETFKKRVAGWTPHLLAPTHRLVATLFSRGFCDALGNPTPKRTWTGLDDAQIIETYNSTLWGLLNYYSFADNRATLTWIQYILHLSCAKTLALKHRTTVRKLFRERGRTLVTEVRTPKGMHFAMLRLESNWKTRSTNFLVGDALDPDAVFRRYQRLRTRSKLDEHCAICGSEDRVQMHHVKHIRKIGQQVRGFTALMAKLNRKQIPVCDGCHDAIHRGKYDGISLNQLADQALARR